MPTLLQISIEVNSGSVGKIAEQIGQLVMNNGWESYITYARNHNKSDSKVIKIGTSWDVIWHGISTRLFDNHCLNSTKATKDLIYKLRKIQPDIIHLHHIHGYYLNMKVLFHYLSTVDIPIVWTFHDCWSFTGHCAHFDFVKCNKWKSECYSCPQKKEYPKSYFLDRSRSNFHLKKKLFTSIKDKMILVPVSNWLGNFLKDSFFSDTPFQTIHNGIDTSLFKPQSNQNEIRKKYGIGDKFLILGVASPWSQKKGFQDFINLSKMLNSDEIIIMVGLNNKQKQKLPKNIIGLKRTENQQQLIDLYSCADLFINPTWEDNFPTTNIEALACGTPVATYNTGGSIEALSNETGFIVEKGSVKGLLNVIVKVKGIGKESFSNKCRIRAVQNFTNKNQFLNYLHLYYSLLKDKKND